MRAFICPTRASADRASRAAACSTRSPNSSGVVESDGRELADEILLRHDEALGRRATRSSRCAECRCRSKTHSGSRTSRARRSNARACRRKTRPTGRPATTRTVSPYFSPAIQIAPVCLASSIGSSRVIRRVVANHLVDARGDRVLLFGRQARRRVAEIEAHAIDADPRTGLRHLVAEHVFERALQAGAPRCDGAGSRAATSRRPACARARRPRTRRSSRRRDARSPRPCTACRRPRRPSRRRAKSRPRSPICPPRSA